MLNWFHVWTPSWLVHDLNILLVQKGCRVTCCMGRGIVTKLRSNTSSPMATFDSSGSGCTDAGSWLHPPPQSLGCVVKFCLCILETPPTSWLLLAENCHLPTTCKFAAVFALANFVAWSHCKVQRNINSLYRNPMLNKSIKVVMARQTSLQVTTPELTFFLLVRLSGHQTLLTVFGHSICNSSPFVNTATRWKSQQSGVLLYNNSRLALYTVGIIDASLRPSIMNGWVYRGLFYWRRWGTASLIINYQIKHFVENTNTQML